MASGAVVTESVFAWPGVGSLFTESLAKRDYTVLMAFLMCASIAVVVLNLVADVAVYRARPAHAGRTRDARTDDRASSRVALPRSSCSSSWRSLAPLVAPYGMDALDLAHRRGCAVVVALVRHRRAGTRPVHARALRRAHLARHRPRLGRGERGDRRDRRRGRRICRPLDRRCAHARHRRDARRFRDCRC